MNIDNQKSLGRLFRQLVFVPMLNTGWLKSDTKDRLASVIGDAELGHRGEIYLIIENHLPINTAYTQGTMGRAVDLFGLHRVWDTADNTGVLVYVNLCEHALHIIADRGINDKHHDWQPLCNNALNDFKNKHFEQGLTQLINELGTILKTHYPDDDISGNELPNRPVHLK